MTIVRCSATRCTHNEEDVCIKRVIDIKYKPYTGETPGCMDNWEFEETEDADND